MEITPILQLNDYVYIGTVVALGILTAYALAKELAERYHIKSLMRDRSISIDNLHENIRNFKR
ncbi:MAG: hypothetical protein QXV17_02405 [Candidatus Micrarchaeaceae archaeon]